MRKLNSACCMLLGLVIAVPFAFAEEQASISRLPPLPQPLDPILQDMFDKRRAMGGLVRRAQVQHLVFQPLLKEGAAQRFLQRGGALAVQLEGVPALAAQLLQADRPPAPARLQGGLPADRRPAPPRAWPGRLLEELRKVSALVSAGYQAA